VQVDRQQRSLVTPVLEQLAVVEGHPVDQPAVVRAEPGEGRQVVGAGEDVDAVDLQQAGVLEHPAQVPPVRGRRRPWIGQPLGGDRDPPRLPDRQ